MYCGLFSFGDLEPVGRVVRSSRCGFSRSDKSASAQQFGQDANARSRVGVRFECDVAVCKLQVTRGRRRKVLYAFALGRDGADYRRDPHISGRWASVSGDSSFPLMLCAARLRGRHC